MIVHDLKIFGTIFFTLGPGRPGLEGIVGRCTLRDGYTPDASLRACGAQLGREGSLLFGAMG